MATAIRQGDRYTPTIEMTEDQLSRLMNHVTTTATNAVKEVRDSLEGVLTSHIAAMKATVDNMAAPAVSNVEHVVSLPQEFVGKMEDVFSKLLDRLENPAPVPVKVQNGKVTPAPEA